MDSLNLKLRIEACSPWVRGQWEDSDRFRGTESGWAAPRQEAPGRGLGAGSPAQPCPLGQKPVPSGPALGQRPCCLLLGGQKPQGRGLWEQDTGSLGDARSDGGSERKGAHASPGLWQHCRPVRNTHPRPSLLPLTRLGAVGGGEGELRGGPARSSALANYCDVSTPLPGSPFQKVLQNHPGPLASDPKSGACPPSPLF